MRELERTPLPGDETGRSLLDEVDVVSSVSGGTSRRAYYGLHGKALFDDFEDRFLRRNV